MNLLTSLSVSFPNGIYCSAFALALLTPQEFGSLEPQPSRSHQFISYAAEQQLVLPQKRTLLRVRFQVEHGYHVNSHTPKSDLLLPTRLEFQPTEGLTVGLPEYPPGQEYTFAFDPREKLDVYADSFTVKLLVTAAAAGPYSLQGTLKYQACDKAACYPPKSLPVTLFLTAK